mmetsp:Transcript_18698/g.35078  ORF Transcript_18698/g.35078 Transcript_18698/m.35078 type:complete len:323 (+) Transcript_18698:120-1088(+)
MILRRRTRRASFVRLVVRGLTLGSRLPTEHAHVMKAELPVAPRARNRDSVRLVWDEDVRPSLSGPCEAGPFLASLRKASKEGSLHLLLAPLCWLQHRSAEGTRARRLARIVHGGPPQDVRTAAAVAQDRLRHLMEGLLRLGIKKLPSNGVLRNAQLQLRLLVGERPTNALRARQLLLSRPVRRIQVVEGLLLQGMGDVLVPLGVEVPAALLIAMLKRRKILSALHGQTSMIAHRVHKALEAVVSHRLGLLGTLADELLIGLPDHFHLVELHPELDASASLRPVWLVPAQQCGAITTSHCHCHRCRSRRRARRRGVSGILPRL